MSQSALDYLSTHTLLFLGTSSSDGDVHIAPMFYAAEGSAIFFSAPEGSATATNLHQNPRAAVAVADVPDDWGTARGLQIEGSVSELHDADEAAAGQLFQAKFPHLGDAAMHSHYWRLDAGCIRYVHNDEGGNETFDSLGQTWTRESVDG